MPLSPTASPSSNPNPPAHSLSHVYWYISHRQQHLVLVLFSPLPCFCCVVEKRRAQLFGVELAVLHDFAAHHAPDQLQGRQHEEGYREGLVPVLETGDVAVVAHVVVQVVEKFVCCKGGARKTRRRMRDNGAKDEEKKADHAGEKRAATAEINSVFKRICSTFLQQHKRARDQVQYH